MQNNLYMMISYSNLFLNISNSRSIFVIFYKVTIYQFQRYVTIFFCHPLIFEVIYIIKKRNFRIYILFIFIVIFSCNLLLFFINWDLSSFEYRLSFEYVLIFFLQYFWSYLNDQ